MVEGKVRTVPGEINALIVVDVLVVVVVVVASLIINNNKEDMAGVSNVSRHLFESTRQYCGSF